MPLLEDALAQELNVLAEVVAPGAKVVADFRRDQLRLENAWQVELSKAFRGLGNRVAAAAAARGGILIEAKDPTSNEKNRIEAILSASRIESWIQQVLKPSFEKRYALVARAVIGTLARHEIKVSARDRIEQQIIREGIVRLRLLDISGDTRVALFRVLDIGRKLGLNPRSTARLIREYVPAGRFTNAGSGYRARLIARTEVLHAQRVASLASYRDSRVVKKVLAFDGDGDAVCAARNGQVFTFDQADAEIGKAHPNCVLALAPVT